MERGKKAGANSQPSDQLVNDLKFMSQEQSQTIMANIFKSLYSTVVLDVGSSTGGFRLSLKHGASKVIMVDVVLINFIRRMDIKIDLREKTDIRSMINWMIEYKLCS